MSERDRDEKREMRDLRQFMCVSVSTARFVLLVGRGKNIGPETLNKCVSSFVFQQMVSERDA